MHLSLYILLYICICTYLRLKGQGKPKIEQYLPLERANHIEGYLTWSTGKWAPSLLIRFRAGRVHHLLGFPLGYTKPSHKTLCLCDHKSVQSLLHFTLLRRFYEEPRKLFLLPIFKDRNLKQCKAALTYLRALGDSQTCFRVGSFLKMCVLYRRSLTF